MHVLSLSCPPIANVRIGLIGLGNRGFATLQRFMVVEGVSFTALCDLSDLNIERSRQFLTEHSPSSMPRFTRRWDDVCHSRDVDLIIICTDWLSHTEIAVEAMRWGKHVAVEVPAAMTVDDCWTLVETAERTRCHCIMLENCCYDPFSLMTLNMARMGLFGDITHCEGAYIHDLRDQFNADEAHGGYHKRWMARFTEQHRGNPYPTHGLGPICQLLDIHRGDRLASLVSMSSDLIYEQRGHDIAENHINNTIIRTVRGRSILIQYDVTTPRPYSRLQTICGTKGYAQKYPLMTLSLDGQPAVIGEDNIQTYMDRYIHSDMASVLRRGRELNVPNVMNYIMDVRLIEALRAGRPLDMDVYDAAEWSCLAELTQRSASMGGQPVQIPDFTKGHWR
ncbi:MAG: Gfo/Idh/MocA family oxidoreductase [Bacteroidaceae bacterium]|nr:Gfo/Idh/MocA family oxidoreductase [Bacteroidaceae bacterium]